MSGSGATRLVAVALGVFGMVLPAGAQDRVRPGGQDVTIELCARIVEATRPTRAFVARVRNFVIPDGVVIDGEAFARTSADGRAAIVARFIGDEPIERLVVKYLPERGFLMDRTPKKLRGWKDRDDLAILSETRAYLIQPLRGRARWQELGPGSLAGAAAFDPYSRAVSLASAVRGDVRASVLESTVEEIVITIPKHEQRVVVDPRDLSIVRVEDPGRTGDIVVTRWCGASASSPSTTRYPTYKLLQRFAASDRERASPLFQSVMRIEIIASAEPPQASEFDWWTYRETAVDAQTGIEYGPGDIPTGRVITNTPGTQAGGSMKLNVEALKRANQDPSVPVPPLVKRGLREWMLAGGLASLVVAGALAYRRWRT